MNSQMKQRPILFSAPMVRAILNGTKTQTRRVVKGELNTNLPVGVLQVEGDPAPRITFGQVVTEMACPYGKAGDRLWVRETWQTYKEFDKVRPCDLSNQSPIQYPATYDGWDSKKRPSIHIPRWASRIELEITNIRAERLQDISEADAKSEGAIPKAIPIRRDEINPPIFMSYKAGFADLWQSINGDKSWNDNPFVWVIEFKRIKP